MKPETSLNNKLDPAIPDAIKSAFVHSHDGLAEAARLFFSVLKVASNDQSKDLFVVV